MSDLDIVIVNWNGGDQLRRCLESLRRFSGGVELRNVVVVDNCSTDGSLDQLDSLDLPLKIVRNDSNRGFGAACNQGASLCRSQYLLFLNPDTEIEEDSLSTPAEFMEISENADVGVCGIQLVDATGKASRSCARFPNFRILCGRALGLSHLAPACFPDIHLSDWAHDAQREVDHVIGAFYFMRRELFVELNGFDERYFVYLEDLDLSRAVIDSGRRIVYLTSARAFHQGGGTSEKIKAKRLFYSRRSRIQYAFKHLSPIAAGLTTLATLVVEPIVMTVYGAMRLSPPSVLQTWCGFALLWGDLPRILGVRSTESSSRVVPRPPRVADRPSARNAA